MLSKSSVYCCALILTVVCLVLSACNPAIRENPQIDPKYQSIDTPYDVQIKSNFGFVEVAQNERFILYIDGQTAEIKLLDKQSGVEWYSNPPGRFDKVEGNMGRISSQVVVQYNIHDKPSIFNSYSDALSEGRYGFAKIDNGVRVDFVMGDKPKNYIVPQVLSIERFEYITSKLSENDKTSLLNYYKLVSINDPALDKESKSLILDKFPILGRKDAYVTQLRTSITETDGNKPFANKYLMEKLEKLFASAGYTEEDLKRDNEENDITRPMLLDFSISLSIEYILDGEEFVVRVPNDCIVFDDSLLQLTQISLIPYFGAADSSKSGYILVPDGSGSLINLNNGKTNEIAYSQNVYGYDYTIPFSTSISSESNYNSEQLFMPVFGMKADDTAFFAVIEDGDGISRIDADISGKSSNYNTVGATFLVNSSQRPNTVSLNAKYSLFYQEKIAQCDCSVRYFFLYGEKANYAGMADIYRNYLLDRGVLKKQELSSSFPLYIQIIQAVDHKKSVLGIPVTMPLALTTCDQTVDILETMKDKGVGDIVLELYGWANNGVRNTVMNKISLMSHLGGEKGLLPLLGYAGENNIQVYLNCDFQYVAKHTALSGFNQSRNAARTLENVASYNVTYSKDMTLLGRKDWAVISPAYYKTIIDSFLKSYKKYPVDGIALQWMGCDLNGDYRSGRMIDRQAAKEIVVGQLENLAAKGYNVNVRGANVYALSGVSFLSNLTTSGGGINICDRSVPFYQMVIHGVIPYSGEPLNRCSDFEYQALKMIETGAIPAFQWMYQDNAVLKNTDYSYYYSVCYKAWVEKAAEIYKTVNEALSGCMGEIITTHEQLSEKVFKTVYKNGVTIYVNYDDSEQLAEGVKIPPMSYTRVRGGAE